MEISIEVSIIGLFLFLLAFPAVLKSKSLMKPNLVLTRHNKFFDIQFVGEEKWIVGDFGLILHSSDAEKNWEEQSNRTSIPLFFVHFVYKRNESVVSHCPFGYPAQTQEGERLPISSSDRYPE